MKNAATAGDQGLPGIFFMYELSPMMVKYTEKQRYIIYFFSGVSFGQTRFR